MKTKETKKKIFKVVLEKETNNIKRQYWSCKEDNLLLNLIADRKQNLKKINWEDISLYFNKASKQCYARYRQINPSLKKGTWSNDEEDKLIELVKVHGYKWAKISKQFGTRSGKQIRQHYKNICDATISKVKFTDEELRLLIDLHKQYGPQWQLISSFFNGRTSDNLKCRYNNYLKRRLNPKNKQFAESLDQKLDQTNGETKNVNNKEIDPLLNSIRLPNFNKTTRKTSKLNINLESKHCCSDKTYTTKEQTIEKITTPITDYIKENNLKINQKYFLDSHDIFDYIVKNSSLEKNKLNYNENENEYVNISNTALLENNYIAMKYTSESNNHFANYLSIFF